MSACWAARTIFRSRLLKFLGGFLAASVAFAIRGFAPGIDDLW
jgi:hypothetical protein